MRLGQSVLIKCNGEVKEGNIINIFPEDLDIKLLDGTIIRRKFWEIRKIDIKIE